MVMITEEPVSFKNRARQEIYGVAHIPCVHGIEKKVGVIFLNPGPGYRIRLYVKLARKLAQQGFYALRFDPVDLGESERFAEELMLFDIYNSINKGQFVPDTIDSINFFIHKCELDEVILIGLCGGAMTALLTAPSCQKLSALILLSFPVLFSTLEADVNTADSSHDRDLLKGYLANLLDFRDGNLYLWGSLLRKIREVGLPKATARFAEAFMGPLKKDRSSLHPSFNKLFLGPFERVKKQIPISFIFGEHDKWRLYFEVEFEQKLLKRNKEKDYRKFMINGENHLFTLKESQDELVSIILSLLPSVGITGGSNASQPKENKGITPLFQSKVRGDSLSGVSSQITGNGAGASEYGASEDIGDRVDAAVKEG
jgi:pimeloyl-ACP methyl ester carboxylesterase